MISVLLHLAFFAGIGFSLVAILWFAHRMSLTHGRAYAWACMGFCASLFVFAVLTLIERFFG